MKYAQTRKLEVLGSYILLDLDSLFQNIRGEKWLKATITSLSVGDVDVCPFLLGLRLPTDDLYDEVLYQAR